jgi:hypothetical protein
MGVKFMNQLSRTDLNRVAIDVDSFLGKAFALGREYEHLPAALEETLITYLRAKAVGFAQRYRSSIALSRDRAGVGIKQALVCVDLALEEQANGDLNIAVGILAGGDFEALRRRGWEMAFERLEEIQRESALLIKHDMMVFLQDMLPQLRVWAGLIPENWTGTNAEEEQIDLDARADFDAFKKFLARLEFLRSLPSEAQKGLLEHWPQGGPFSGVLRHMIVALSLGIERLVFDKNELEDFKHRCFSADYMDSQVKEQMLAFLDRHLEQSLKEERARTLIRGQVEEEIAILESAEREAISGLFMVPGKAKT